MPLEDLSPKRGRVRIRPDPAILHRCTPDGHHYHRYRYGNIGAMNKGDSADKLPDSEIAERMDRALRRMIETPPTPHKPLGKKARPKKRRKAKSPS